jgi:hypothetical protein
MVIIVLGLNGYFSYKDSLKSFDIEIAQYSYVEENARVLLTASLAIAIFFQYLGLDKIEISANIKKSIEFPIIMAFIFSCLIITLIWMPTHSGLYIRILRDIKTIFLILSIASVILSMINTITFT